MNQIHERDEWTTRPPKVVLPYCAASFGIAVHWTGPGVGDYVPEQVPAILRAIQNYHMDHNGWSDFAYNAAVDKFGDIWVGRGKNTRCAANGTTDANDRALAIVYLGGEDDPFTDEAKQGLITGLNYLRDTVGPGTNGHRDWYTTHCPGDEIYAWVINDVGQTTPGAPPVPEVFPDFPLPAGHWFGLPNPDPRNHSGLYDADDAQGVRILQEGLDRLSRPQPGDESGHFGSATAEAVTQFQSDATAYGFDTGGVDGLCGEKTWGVLKFQLG